MSQGENIDYGVLAFVTSSLEHSTILHVLNSATELSKSDIISESSIYIERFGISKDFFEDNIDTYLLHLSILNIVEIENDIYKITPKGKFIYSLFEVSFKSVASM
jgi:hypothetical protein